MREPDPRWCSPYHVNYSEDGPSVGMKPCNIFGGHIRRKLTDRAIHRYALLGYFGWEQLCAAQESDARKHKRKKRDTKS